MKDQLKKIESDLCKLIGMKEDGLTMHIYDSSAGVQYTAAEFFDHYNPEEIQKGQCNLVFRIDSPNKTMASFQLKDMYNCSGIIVGSDLFVSKEIRNRGVGTLITKFIHDFSKYYGYGILQAADKLDNIYQKRIFEKLGWKMVSEFVNPKTNNALAIWLLNLS